MKFYQLRGYQHIFYIYTFLHYFIMIIKYVCVEVKYFEGYIGAKKGDLTFSDRYVLLMPNHLV